jgi:uncharacterized membrane protein YidH (DUF202 family)
MSEETVLKAEVRNKNLRASWPAILLIGIGLVLLSSKVFGFFLMDFMWPGFVVGSGLLMLYPAYISTPEKRRSLAFFAIPGAMTVATGILLFMMNLTNHFESMAYAWTLILAAGAGGYIYYNRFEDTDNSIEKAHRFIRTMVLLFMGMAMFFELLIFQSFGYWWPLIIIGLGAYMLIKERRSKSDE